MHRAERNPWTLVWLPTLHGEMRADWPVPTSLTTTPGTNRAALHTRSWKIEQHYHYHIHWNEWEMTTWRKKSHLNWLRLLLHMSVSISKCPYPHKNRSRWKSLSFYVSASVSTYPYPLCNFMSMQMAFAQDEGQVVSSVHDQTVIELVLYHQQPSLRNDWIHLSQTWCLITELKFGQKDMQWFYGGMEMRL